MLKKIFVIGLCVIVSSFYSAVSAHDSFTWFGFRRNNTEVTINSSTHHSDVSRCNGSWWSCHKHRHKPPKPHKKPKPHKHHKHHKHH